MDQSKERETPSGMSKTLLAGIILAGFSFVVFFMSGYGYNWQIWGLGPAFQVFKWGAVGGLAGLLLTLIGLGKAKFTLNTASATMSWISVILAVTVVGTAIYFIVRARTVPPIHDITTNFEDPPQFKVLQDLREKAPNEVEYPGGKTAELQKKNYPEVAPLWLDMSRKEAFTHALESARQMRNWKIQSSDSSNGRIEATHTIMWFGFKDDVVIRIQPDTARGLLRIDMRSASRIGKSDLGENAKRIKRYMNELRSRVEDRLVIQEED